MRLTIAFLFVSILIPSMLLQATPGEKAEREVRVIKRRVVEKTPPSVEIVQVPKKIVKPGAKNVTINIEKKRKRPLLRLFAKKAAEAK